MRGAKRASAASPHTTIENIVDVMSSGRNNVSREFPSGQCLRPLGALKLPLPSSPLASSSFCFYCFDMKEAADRDVGEQALGKVPLLTRFYSQQVHLDVGCNLRSDQSRRCTSWISKRSSSNNVEQAQRRTKLKAKSVWVQKN